MGGVRVDPSEGPSGDRRIDEALAALAEEAKLFAEANNLDASAVAAAGNRLHDVLQSRLGEAQT